MYTPRCAVKGRDVGQGWDPPAHHQLLLSQPLTVSRTWKTRDPRTGDEGHCDSQHRRQQEPCACLGALARLRRCVQGACGCCLCSGVPELGDGTSPSSVVSKSQRKTVITLETAPCKHSRRNVPGRVTAPLWLASCIALLSPRTGVLPPQRTHPTLSPPPGKLPPRTCEGDWAGLLSSWPTPDAWNSHAMRAPSPPTLGNLWECT